MKMLWTALLLMLAVGSARATEADLFVLQSGQWVPLVGTTAKPAPVVGYGALSVSNSSVALSTLTAGLNSPAWAMPFANTVYVKNSEASAGNVFVCPQGGTCTTSIGIPLGPGASYGFNLGTSTTAPTTIASSTATLAIQW